MKTGIGYLLAVMPGGVAIGVALLESTALNVGEFLVCRAAIGALGGAVPSLISDASKKIVDGQDVTWCKVMSHAAACGDSRRSCRGDRTCCYQSDGQVQGCFSLCNI